MDKKPKNSTINLSRILPLTRPQGDSCKLFTRLSQAAKPLSGLMPQSGKVYTEIQDMVFQKHSPNSNYRIYIDPGMEPESWFILSTDKHGEYQIIADSSGTISDMQESDLLDIPALERAIADCVAIATPEE